MAARQGPDMTRTAWVSVLFVAAGLAGGCVERRFIVNTEPQGALVYINNQYVGASPVDYYYTYYGKYEIKVVREGYEPLTVLQNVEAPWYELPGIDFISENMILLKLRDVRSFCYALKPMQAVRPEDLLGRASELRARGQTIGTPRAARPGGTGLGPPQVAPPPGAVAPPPGAVPGPAFNAPSGP